MNWQRIFILSSSILFLAGLSACGPDLHAVPNEAFPDIDHYCRYDELGYYQVLVKNSGTEDVTIPTTTWVWLYEDPGFEVCDTEPVEYYTPPLRVGETALITTTCSPFLMLHAQVEVDFYNEVDEGYGFWEINNSVGSYCNPPDDY